MSRKTRVQPKAYKSIKVEEDVYEWLSQFKRWLSLKYKRDYTFSDVIRYLDKWLPKEARMATFEELDVRMVRVKTEE